VTSDDRTTGEWLCVVDQQAAGLDRRDDMTVQVEVKEDAGDRDQLARVLEDRLKSDLGIRVTVELVAAGSLAAFTYGREGKARRLLDKRRAAPPPAGAR
jgi:phenylacetate-CoA ligase